MFSFLVFLSLGTVNLNDYTNLAFVNIIIKEAPVQDILIIECHDDLKTLYNGMAFIDAEKTETQGVTFFVATSAIACTVDSVNGTQTELEIDLMSIPIVKQVHFKEPIRELPIKTKKQIL